ncbi:unnamed protein product, partial [Brassica rapa subsp. narinosa]
GHSGWCLFLRPLGRVFDPLLVLQSLSLSGLLLLLLLFHCCL